MLKYFTGILFLLFSFCASAQDDEDFGEETEQPVIKVDSVSQLRFNIDISKPVLNSFSGNRKSYEFEIDYYFRKELYFVAEAGWGNAVINYPDLQYNSSNTFFKAGINKCILSRQSAKDWDMAFAGIRYGVTMIERGAASYTIVDSFWGNSPVGTVTARNITGHWAEITGGVRVEIIKGLYAGWNVRGKFRLNQKPFKELPPSYIAGYGVGSKNSIFDFNFYLGYAIRWQRKMPVVSTKE